MAQPNNAEIMKAIADLSDRMERRFTTVEQAILEVRGDIKTVNARLDEQRATINALIPTRIAAVPGRPDDHRVTG